MNITFVKHSCYTVETEKHFLIFDYIGGELNIPENKNLIFLVSHRHQDHYSNLIFKYRNNAKYIISDDCTVENLEKVTLISPNEDINIEGLRIKTAGSTDEGVSFYVKCDNQKIFHSGDLCYWLWDSYSKEDIENMDKWFKSEVDKFKNLNIDVAMIPIDPRLKEHYKLTAEYYLKTLNAKNYFPMHMWEDFNMSKKFKNDFKDEFPQKIIHIVEHDNQKFKI